MFGQTRLIILSVCFGAFISCLDSYIVSITLPEVATALGTDIVSVSGVTVYYLLFMTCTLLVWGKLADRFGARRLYLLGYVIFTVGSLLCGLSHTLDMLIVSRCIQSLGGAALFAIGMSIIATHMPRSTLGKAYGWVATTAAVGLTLGAPVGGFITGIFNWRGVFLVNVPLGIAAWLLTRQAIPRQEERLEKNKGFDLAGALLSSTALCSLIWSLTASEREGWQSQSFLVFLGLGIALSILFVFQERRHPNPLLNPAVFEHRGFSLCVGLGFILMVVLGGMGLVVPFHLIWSKGLPVETAGLLMSLNSVIGSVFNPYSGALADRIGTPRMCLASMTLAFCLALYFALSAQEPGVFSTVVLLLGLGLASSLYFPGGNALIMRLAPEGHKGAASGVNTTARTLGMTMGASIFAALMPPHETGNHLPETAMRVPWLFAATILAVAIAMCFPLLKDERCKKWEKCEQ